jgi:hypothetical protein
MDAQDEWSKRITKARASALLFRLTDALFESPILTIPQAQRLLKITYLSAQSNVQKLIGAGILEPLGSSAYGKTFVAPEVLRILGESKNEK